jgi:hypothetical protein
MKNRTMQLIALGALAAGILVGCGASAPAPAEAEKSGGFFEDKWHLMPDGRTVYCLYKEGRIGGHSSGNPPAMACDFAGATVHH